MQSTKELARELAAALARAREEESEEAPTRLAWQFDRARLFNDDWEALGRAIEHRAQMPEAHALRFGRWEFIGPNAFLLRGDYVSGRVNAIAIDPRDANTIYGGAAGGGVWKTIDNGLTWEPLSDTWPYLEISSIAIDPTNSSIVYAGTGDFDGGPHRRFGVMKSMDGGVTWSRLPVDPIVLSMSISAIVVDPDDPWMVTICGGHGHVRSAGTVWRSILGGTSWKRVLRENGDWKNLVLGAPDASNVRAMYLCGTDSDGKGRIYVSWDRGEIFSPLTASWIEKEKVLAVATSPLRPQRVYAIAGTSRMIWMSDDHGASWTDITFDFPRTERNWEDADYHSAIACGTTGDPQRDLVYVGLTDFFIWDSAGKTWKEAPNGHVDVHGFAVDPEVPSRRVLIANDGGVYESKPAGFVWRTVSRNEKLGITQCYRGSGSQFNANICITGTQDNGTASAQGDLRRWKDAGGGDVIDALVNPANEKIQFREAGVRYHGIRRTADQWLTSEDITPSTDKDQLDPMSMPMAMHALGTHLYWASDFLWIREERTGKWDARVGGQKLCGPGDDEHWVGVRCIGIAESDPWRIYTGSTDGQIWMVQGPDWKWTRLDEHKFFDVISAIAVHPRDKNDILVATGRTGAQLWRCRDTTASPPVWELASGLGAGRLPPLPAVGVVRDPVNPNTHWFVALDVGVYYTEVGGTDWRDITVPWGLPNVQLAHLHLSSNRLHAFTYGRGVWRLDLTWNG